MSQVSRQLNEDVTHWPVTGSNGYGGFTFGTPIKLKGRWEDKAVIFRTLENEEVVSNAIVYLATDIDVGDYFGRGDLTATLDPTTLDDAFRSRNYHRSTNLRALEALRKVFL